MISNSNLPARLNLDWSMGKLAPAGNGMAE